MAKNFVQMDGNVVELVAPGGGVISGKAVVVGTLFVIPLISAAAGAKFTAKLDGVVRYAKKAALAITEGQKLGFDISADELVDFQDVNSDLSVGVAVAAQGGADATADLKIIQLTV